MNKVKGSELVRVEGKYGVNALITYDEKMALRERIFNSIVDTVVSTRKKVHVNPVFTDTAHTVYTTQSVFTKDMRNRAANHDKVFVFTVKGYNAATYLVPRTNITTKKQEETQESVVDSHNIIRNVLITNNDETVLYQGVQSLIDIDTTQWSILNNEKSFIRFSDTIQIWKHNKENKYIQLTKNNMWVFNPIK